jgi:hypothetical protein
VLVTILPKRLALVKAGYRERAKKRPRLATGACSRHGFSPPQKAEADAHSRASAFRLQGRAISYAILIPQQMMKLIVM